MVTWHTCWLGLGMTCLPAWSLLLGLGAKLAGRLGQDSPLGNDNDVLSAELLLELAHNSVLDFLESLQLRHGHVDDDGLLAGNIDLLGARDVQFSELGLEFAVHLQVQQSLSTRRRRMG